MVVEIKALKPALLDDFLHFFDDIGFVDNPGWSVCYCQFYQNALTNKEWGRCTKEQNRKAAIKAEIKAYQEELEREAQNTTLARFIRNLESRIYAQLSRQLVENLFGETKSESGSIELEGNTIEYSVDGDYITLTITDADGNETIITLPIGSFTF